MEPPFSFPQIITLIMLYSSGLIAHVRLQFSVTEAKRRLDAMDVQLQQVRDRQATALLIEQAVTTLSDTVTEVKQEMKDHRLAMERIGQLIVRLETRMERKAGE